MGKKKIVIVIAIVIILIGGGITTYVCLADKTIKTLDDEKAVTEAMVEESPAENEELDKEEETLSDEAEKPETEKPEIEKPEIEKPETEKPEPDKEEQTQVTSGTTQAAQTVDIDDKPASETQPVSQDTPSAPSAPASGQTDAPTQPETTEAPAVSDTTDDETSKTWVPAVYEDVWVVDQEAFSYENPIYETRAKDVCNGCGADVTVNPDAHFKAQIAAGNTSCGGYHIEYYQVQIGTETIEVEEVGHWEKVLVSEGYWK